MKTVRLGELCLLAVLAAPISGAASGPEPGAALRWPAVVAAVDRHPLVREANAVVQGATGVVWTAQEIPNPIVGVSGGDAFARGGTGYRREWGYSVELPLEFLVGRRQRVAAARASAEGAGHDAQAVRLEVTRELRRVFVALAHAQAAVEAGTEIEGEVARLAALVRRRVERGEGRPSEVARVVIELERLRGGLERSRAVAESRRERLSTWVGVKVMRVEAGLAEPLPLPPLDELLRRSLDTSPALRAARARVAAAAEGRSAERWDRLPGLSIGRVATEELDRSASTVTATLTFPIWNWNRGRIRQAEAALEAGRARLDAASRELTAALTEAWQGCAAGQSSSRRFRDEILPLAEGSARTLGRAFELGEAGLLDVIDGRRVLLDTRREYLDLLLDTQNACGDLAALAGLELP